jgi:5-oxoprolinase (ATP-hydrolysing) subunit A
MADGALAPAPYHRDVAVIDLNADLGEGFGAWRMGDDEAMLRVVSSANVACGFHAGDPSIMRRTCDLAVEHGVAVGAHVSYRDLAGFGRRDIAVSETELADEVLYQLGALDACCRAAGTRVRYVKPHGALYNRCFHDDEHAAAVVAAVRAYDRSLAVLGAPGSRLLALATDCDLATCSEAFTDRSYLPSGELLPRGRPGAVFTSVEQVVAQSLTLALAGTAATVTGDLVVVRARSLCVHGDTPGAVAMAQAVRDALEDAGVTVAPFA